MKITEIREQIKTAEAKCGEVAAQYRGLGKPILVLAVLYILAISAIVRANVNYIDDIGRATSGAKSWENFSRFLSNSLSSLVHVGNYLGEISPLTQYLAVAMLALSGVVLLHLLTGKTQFSAWQLVATLPLGLSPYFLECLSYKFDSPYMALSVLVCILPLALQPYGPVAYCLASFAGTLAMCTTYQAASGIYPMLVVLLFCRRWNQKEDPKQNLLFLLQSVVSYVAGIVVFQKFIMVPTEDYVSNTLPPLAQLPATIVANLQRYYGLVSSDFKSVWKLLVVLLLVAYLYVVVRDSMQNKLLALLVNAVGLAAMALLCFGLYPALERPLYNPRAMYGFGAMLAFLSATVLCAKKAYPLKWASLALCWAFVVFAFQYGNALRVQQNYDEFRMEMLLTDLNELPQMNTDQPKKMQLVGSVGNAPALGESLQGYGMLRRLIPGAFAGGWYWGEEYLYHYYGIKNVEQMQCWTGNVVDEDLPLLKDTMYHTIQGNEEQIRITLK